MCKLNVFWVLCNVAILSNCEIFSAIEQLEKFVETEELIISHLKIFAEELNNVYVNKYAVIY